MSTKLEVAIGLDEVGRGALAGPVVAGAVSFQVENLNFKVVRGNNCNKFIIKGDDVLITDSKKMTPSQREVAASWIRDNAVFYGLGIGSVLKINRRGIVQAANFAFRSALQGIKSTPNHNTGLLLIDAFFVPRVGGFPTERQRAIVHGDAQIIEIAAASIIAKVYRDALMQKLSKNAKFEKYMWYKNKGYGTKDHREAIITHGVTKHHRNLFVRNFL